MEVVVEQRVSEDTPAATGGMTVEEPPPIVSVLVAEDDVATFKTALSHVVDTLSNVEPWLSRHGKLQLACSEICGA